MNISVAVDCDVRIVVLAGIGTLHFFGRHFGYQEPDPLAA